MIQFNYAEQVFYESFRQRMEHRLLYGTNLNRRNMEITIDEQHKTVEINQVVTLMEIVNIFERYGLATAEYKLKVKDNQSILSSGYWNTETVLRDPGREFTNPINSGTSGESTLYTANTQQLSSDSTNEQVG